MRVFVTGATGFIGSLVVRDLIDAGHQVLGLARSDVAAQRLVAAGAQAHRGDVEDVESLRRGAAGADGVIHTAFIHDFSKMQEICEIDRCAIAALGAALAGPDRPLVVTSVTGVANTAPGELAREDGAVLSAASFPRAAPEAEVASMTARGVNVSIVRLPQVHDTVRFGLVSRTIAAAREKGVSAYVGEGRNRWPAAHVRDAALLYRLALEKRETGAKYHAVAEDGVPYRDIAETIGRRLKMPVVSLTSEQAAEHFGWLAMFVGRDLPASSAQTRERLGWNPAGPGLLSDLEQGITA